VDQNGTTKRSYVPPQRRNALLKAREKADPRASKRISDIRAYYLPRKAAEGKGKQDIESQQVRQSFHLSEDGGRFLPERKPASAKGKRSSNLSGGKRANGGIGLRRCQDGWKRQVGDRENPPWCDKSNKGKSLRPDDVELRPDTPDLGRKTGDGVLMDGEKGTNAGTSSRERRGERLIPEKGLPFCSTSRGVKK